MFKNIKIEPIFSASPKTHTRLYLFFVLIKITHSKTNLFLHTRGWARPKLFFKALEKVPRELLCSFLCKKMFLKQDSLEHIFFFFFSSNVLLLNVSHSKFYRI